MVLDIINQAEKIIKDAKNANEAEQNLELLFSRYQPPVPLLSGTKKADMLVSSLLVSQIPIFPLNKVMAMYRDKFNKELGQLKSLATFFSRAHDAHAEALSDFAVRNRRVVYYSSDIYSAREWSVYNPDGSFMGKHYPHNSSLPIFYHNYNYSTDLGDPFRGIKGIHIIHNQNSNQLWTWRELPSEKMQLGPAQYIDTNQDSQPDDLNGDGRPNKVKIKVGRYRKIDAVILKGK